MKSVEREIIDIQTEMIRIYEDTFRFLNKVMMDVYRGETANVDLRNFASDTNDCIVDQPRLHELKDRLATLNGKISLSIDKYKL